jgi:hypothetical protein
MADRPAGPTPDPSAGNFAVPAGALLVAVGFFLPWVVPGVTGLEMASNERLAYMTLASLRFQSDDPLGVTRPLYLVPVLALICLMLDLTVTPGSPGRAAVRFSILAAGIALSLFFVFMGLAFGGMLAYGFWGSLTGSLFITVGAGFNVVRKE